MRTLLAPAVLDLLGVAAAYLLATGVRLGGRIDSPEHTGAALVVLMAGAGQVAANLAFRVYRRDWAVAALEDVVALGSASALVAVGLFGLNLFSPDNFVPNGAILPGLALAIVVQAAVKLRPRWPQIARAAFGRGPRGEGALVVGAGNTGQLLARELAGGERGTRVMAFVDDDPRRRGTYIRGIPVEGGVSDLLDLIRRYRPGVVVIAERDADAAFVRRVLERCRGTGVRVRAVSDLGLGRSDRSPLRPIAIDELLQREPVSLDSPRASAFVRDKTIVVTGGAGSIGGELSRRLLELGPKRLVLLDTDESGLHDMLRSLGDPSGVEIELGDVRDLATVTKQIAGSRPDVVFHAAAYKHVPIVERQPAQGIGTNVLGASNVLRAAASSGASVVFVSSDKAVRPANVLGLTKRFGELLTLAHAQRDRRPHAVVRFGNVLGSSGSVVPVFSRQIDHGGPITLTDARATRYFMTPAEAAGLVIHAAALAEPGGDLLVLDMGEPVTIMELARTMVWLRGLSAEEIDIVTVGLRPGEKLHEDLFFAHETVIETTQERVMRVENVAEAVPPIDVLERTVEEIRAELARDDVDAAIALLRNACARSTPEAVAR